MRTKPRNHNKILQKEKERILKQDMELSPKDKIILINAIENRQDERYANLRRARNYTHVALAAKHALMQFGINLIREQRERQRRLIASL